MKIPFAKIISLILIPLVGILAGLYLTKINQDIRQQASEGVYDVAVGASGLCSTLSCPAGQTVTPVPGIQGVCQCKGEVIAASTTAQSAVSDGQCLAPGESCAGGVSFFDISCHLTETRCGTAPSPTPTPTPPPPAAPPPAAPAASQSQTGRNLGECLAPGETCRSGAPLFDATCHLTETRCGGPLTQTTLTVPDDQCVPHNSGGNIYVCENGSGFGDSTCGGRNWRCGARPTPTPTLPADKCTVQQHLHCTFGCDTATGQCKQGKANNEVCSSNAECQSLNCAAGPGGKYCLEAGASFSPKVVEGGRCGTTAYNRECQEGLVCQANKCVAPASIEVTPIGNCLVTGTNCQDNQGYADSSCSSGMRCGARPTPTPTPTPTPPIVVMGVSVPSLMSQVDTEPRPNNDICIYNHQCASGACNAVGGKRICTVNVNSTGPEARFDSGATCQKSCSDQGGDAATCRSICSQYNTSDENLIAIGQTINNITFGTFAEYLAANIELNNEGLTGWERYTDPRALEANTKFGLVLTAEGALAYTGIGALTGTGSAATFGATANLVNTGYSTYQAQQACAGAVTPQEKENCTAAIGYAVLAAANLGTSGLSLAAQSADDVARAAQLANQARLTNAAVSAVEVGVNVHQTYQACQGPNANTQACLIQGGLSVVHGLGSYGDIAYAANRYSSLQELKRYNAALQQSFEAAGGTVHRYETVAEYAQATGTEVPVGARYAGHYRGGHVHVAAVNSAYYQQVLLHELGHALRDIDAPFTANIYDFVSGLPQGSNFEAKVLIEHALEEVGNITGETLPILKQLGLTDLAANEQRYLEYHVQNYVAGLKTLDQPSASSFRLLQLTDSDIMNANLHPDPTLLLLNQVEPLPSGSILIP